LQIGQCNARSQMSTEPAYSRLDSFGKLFPLTGAFQLSH
jgi:hypothetical protein